MSAVKEVIGKQKEIVAEAEELLPGWRTEVKIRKAGSAKKIDRYYTDPVTGYIFRSLKDVQRYLKTGELGKLAIKPKDNTCVDMDVEDGARVSENASGPCKKTVEVSDANLPDAIRSDKREGKSESKEQMMVPSPLSETSRHKRPLEYGSEGYKTRSKSSETSKSESLQRASKRLAGDAPLPSPPEPKTRQATRLAGIKIDAPLPSPPEPKTRQATRFKTDVSPPPSLPEPKTRQAARIAGIEVDASAPSQPEPKTRQASRQAGIRVDASVPSSPDLKTREARRIAGMETDASPPEPKTRHARRLAGMEIDASPPSLPEPKTHQTLLAGMEIGASPPPLPEPKTRQATQLAGKEIGASPPSLPEHKTRQATRIDASLPERKTRQATRLAGIKIDSPPPPSPPEPRTSRQASVRRAREAETRSSINLATPKENEKIGEVDKSTSGEMQVECVGEITEKHDGNADMDNKPSCKQEISILLPPANQESREKMNKDDFKAEEKQKFIFSPEKHYKEIEMVSPPAPKEQALPTVVPPVNMGIQMDYKHHEKQELPVVNPSVPQAGHESSMSFSMNDFWTDPCIEFAVKTLTGAIPFGDLNKADNYPATQLEVPLEELWTDPCIEFAVKTLTGAIPVGEEARVQDYLQQQPSSRSDVHSFSLPDVGMNFCQTEVLSKHFETAHNKQQQQQDSVGNGVLQKSGNTVFPQAQGSNGQCSRPRFSE